MTAFESESQPGQLERSVSTLRRFGWQWANRLARNRGVARFVRGRDGQGIPAGRALDFASDQADIGSQTLVAMRARKLKVNHRMNSEVPLVPNRIREKSVENFSREFLLEAVE